MSKVEYFESDIEGRYMEPWHWPLIERLSDVEMPHVRFVAWPGPVDYAITVTALKRLEDGREAYQRTSWTRELVEDTAFNLPEHLVGQLDRWIAKHS